MTTWFVTRHEGAIDWAKKQGIISEGAEFRSVSEISPEQITLGDVVIGTLPIHLVSEICARGGRYLHIAMNVPADKRGTELSADEMVKFGALCRQFLVFESAAQAVASQKMEPPKQGEGVHVCLVSAQYMANILPILKRRPAYVELVCTPEMARDGGGLDKLARALQHFGYGPESITPHLTDADCSTDFESARKTARNLRDELIRKYPNTFLTLNATGGTKTLSTAFFVEFQGIETIYTDTQRGNCIRFLGDQKRDAEPLGVQFKKIDDYLYCQGYQIIDVASYHKEYLSIVKKRVVTTQLLADNFKNPICLSLNREVAQTEHAIFNGKVPKSEEAKEKQINAVVQNFPIKSFKPGGWMQSKLCNAGLISQTDNNEYVFTSANSMKYLSGGWLEEWAWDFVKSCQVDDCSVNVSIRSLAEDNEGATVMQKDNELDLVLLHNNQLLIAECKTIKWHGESAKQEIFNKLDALGTHARGLFGESILISAQELDRRALRRAKAYGVKVIQADELSHLKDEILRWMGKPPETPTALEAAFAIAVPAR